MQSQVLILAVLYFVVNVNVNASKRSFTIDYENNQFLKDGKPFRYISSSLHYFRVPRFYWADRMTKYKLLGIDTIQTYVEWSQHEKIPNKCNFEGENDLMHFLKLAQNFGLNVILRPGPYIDAERDFGGLPYWLLKNKNLKLRSSDPSYMVPLRRWMKRLLRRIKPFMYENGGPIICVQVENEYGSYFTHDKEYTVELRNIIREGLGNNTLLFSVDGAGVGYLKYGTIPEVYATVDFGSGAVVWVAFGAQRKYEPKGPLVNSEYYPGWLDHWGEPHANVSADSVANTLDKMLKFNASVNIYLAHGGTSFGFLSGSNADSNSFKPCPTSYDYDAPISEAGDLTPKFFKIRNVIKKYKNMMDTPIPPNEPKMSLGPFKMNKIVSLMDAIKVIKPIVSERPLTFEDLNQAYGYVMYSTVIKQQHRDPEILNINGIRDRGYIFVDNEFKGILSRAEKVNSAAISVAKGQTLSIIVENQGRVCYGSYLTDRKGIVSPVYYGKEELLNWSMIKVPLQDEVWLNETMNSFESNDVCSDEYPAKVPAFYLTDFVLPESGKKYPLDTFLRVDGWSKGNAFINDFNIGRYWPVVGPQVTLYVPKNLFKPYPEVNRLILLELEHAPCNVEKDCVAKFVDVPEIDGPTPTAKSHSGFSTLWKK